MKPLEQRMRRAGPRERDLGDKKPLSFVLRRPSLSGQEWDLVSDHLPSLCGKQVLGSLRGAGIRRWVSSQLTS